MATRKLAALAALLLAGTLGLAGCSNGPSSSAGGANPSDSQLNKVLKAGVLRVAVLPDFPPWAVQKSDGSFQGYEIDIAKELADSLGVKLKLVATDGDSRLPLMQSNRVDVNISAWTATNERAQTAGFTIPYDAHGAGVLFKKGTDIKSYKDIAGKTVAVARGSTNDTILTNDYPSAKPVRFDAIADVISAVKTGKVDAALESSYTVAQAGPEPAGDLEPAARPPAGLDGRAAGRPGVDELPRQLHPQPDRLRRGQPVAREVASRAAGEHRLGPGQRRLIVVATDGRGGPR
jgi:polar amino acid transport system substrate-binding protein